MEPQPKGITMINIVLPPLYPNPKAYAKVLVKNLFYGAIATVVVGFLTEALMEAYFAE